jgi:accessory gene regulator protein AgrB
VAFDGSLQCRTGERPDSLGAVLFIERQKDEQNAMSMLLANIYLWFRGVSGMILFLSPYFSQVNLSPFRLAVANLVETSFCFRN